MKKIIIALMMLCTFAAYAENENAATSKEYVDTEIATKQPIIPAEGNNVVITFDSAADDGIGTKQIYDESASYASQTDALVTAGTANAAMQMAIQGEFYCKEWSTIVENDCWLWGIKAHTPSKNLLNPANIHQGTIASKTGKSSPNNPNRCYFDFISVHSGDTVNFTSSITGRAPIYPYIFMYSTNNEDSYIGIKYRDAQITPDANHTGYSFVIRQDGYIRGIWLSNEYNFTTDDIVEAMVEISPTPSPYEPYQQTYLPENQQ